MTNRDQDGEHHARGKIFFATREARGARARFGQRNKCVFQRKHVLYRSFCVLLLLLFFALRVQTRERRNRQRWIDSGCELGIPRLRR